MAAHEPPFAAPARALAVRSIAEQSELDHLLYNTPRLLHLSLEEQRKTAFEFVARSVRDHIERCPPYRRLCAAEGFAAEQLACFGDLARVPLIPTASFKRRLIASVPREEVVKLCVSSGTSGERSCVPRDHETLERFLAGTGVLVDLLLEPFDRAHLFNLGPDADEAGDLWIAYVLCAMEIRFESAHYVVRDELRLDRLVRDLRRAERERPCILVGPPILFLHLLEYLDARGIALDLGSAGSCAVTAGGWKRFGGSAISREALAERLGERLGLDRARIRDAYNMVELNTVLLECDRGRKHVPPWLVAAARDPRTLAPLPDGSEGLLAFLDATAASYPGFVLSDDFGTVDTAACACGRTAPSVDFVRRVEGVEARGCALKMDRDIRVHEGVESA